MDPVFSDLSVGLIHCYRAIVDVAVLNGSQVQMRDVFAVGIECHVTCDALVSGQSGQGIADSAPIQARAADCIQQDPHFVIGQGRKMVWLLMVSSFVACDEVEPSWI